MANYLFTYYGGMVPETPEDQEKVMKVWMEWFKELRDSIVDLGSPTVPGKVLSKDGVKDIGPTPIMGYTVIKADNLDGAIELGKGCPGIPEGGQLAIYELVQMGTSFEH